MQYARLETTSYVVRVLVVGTSVNIASVELIVEYLLGVLLGFLRGV